MKRKRIPFLFFFLFYSCCNHDRHMLYVRMRIFNEMLSQTNERANEKNSFVFFLFHFFFVSLCFVLWLSFRLENNESRSIHGYFIRHTHTLRESSNGRVLLTATACEKDKTFVTTPTKWKENFHFNKSIVKKSSAIKNDIVAPSVEVSIAITFAAKFPRRIFFWKFHAEMLRLCLVVMMFDVTTFFLFQFISTLH
jgi:hypothetical protein